MQGRRQQAKKIFLEAVELGDAQRRDYLESACGDDQALRAEVELLLKRENVTTHIYPNHADQPRRDWSLAPGDMVADRFEILRSVGRGAMGEVYEAQDHRLGKLVALKTLRPELIHDPERFRDFMREIRSGQEVSHPNVCRIHDLVREDPDKNGKLYFTMELIAGGTLRHFLKRKNRPLSIPEALPLIRQMAAGLGELHQHDIVHRDFKPGNVMLAKTLEGGPVVKVSDFGLARPSLPTGPPDTWPGSGTGIEGTPRYMAPEQFTTLSEDIGPACDIYALGTVIYEMVTGHTPYECRDLFELATKKKQEPPPPPRTYAAELDEAWETTILQCLERSPEDRPASATQVVEALEAQAPAPRGKRRGDRTLMSRSLSVNVAAGVAIGAVLTVLLALLGGFFRGETVGPAVGDSLRVAVLPITVDGEDAALQAKADGLTEIITLRLSEHRLAEGELAVEPASEVRRLGIGGASEARREFQSHYAVESELRVEGDEVELALSLVDARNPDHVREQVIRGAAGDVFGIQDRAVSSLARMLEALPRSGGSRVAGAPHAYEAYVTGVGFLARFDVAGNLDQAVDAFERALAIDPEYASAHAGLAEAYLRQFTENREPAKLERAKESAERAVELDDMLAYSHVILGEIYRRSGNLDGAVSELREATKLNPLDGNAHRELAKTYHQQGRLEEAEQEFAKVQPKDWRLLQARGGFYYRTRRYEEAARDLEAATKENPSSGSALWSLGGVYTVMGRYAEAADNLQKALEIRPDARIYVNLGVALYCQGLFEDAAAAHRRGIEMGGVRYVAWGNLADALHWNSQRQEAAESYEEAISLAKKTLAANPANKAARLRIPVYQAKLGRCDDARKSLAQVAESSSGDTEFQTRAALVHELCGRRDEALSLLERAFGEGHSLTEIEHDPWYAALRRSERYRRIAQGRRRQEDAEERPVQ